MWTFDLCISSRKPYSWEVFCVPLITWKCVCLLSPKLSSVEVFIIGAVAKAVATTVTYPLQTIQSILRVSFDGLCLWVSVSTCHIRGMWLVDILCRNVYFSFILNKYSKIPLFQEHCICFLFHNYCSSVSSTSQRTSQNCCPAWGLSSVCWSTGRGGCKQITPFISIIHSWYISVSPLRLGSLHNLKWHVQWPQACSVSMAHSCSEKLGSTFSITFFTYTYTKSFSLQGLRVQVLIMTNLI